MSDLANQFLSILEAPDYTPGRRRELMLVFAHANKAEIAEGLKLRNRAINAPHGDSAPRLEHYSDIGDLIELAGSYYASGDPSCAAQCLQRAADILTEQVPA